MTAIRRNPFLALATLGILAALQVMGMVGQLRAGFVPLRTAPIRVPFSWDMFSIEISRCDIEWSPKLPVGRGYAHLRDFGTAIEWDPVYNEPQHYFYAALQGCSLRSRSTVTHVTLRCVTPEGPLHHELDCP